MTEQQIQKKLDQLAKIANELSEAAKELYGPDGALYYEAGGSFVLLRDGEPCSDSVTFRSQINCRMDCGGF